MERFEATGSPVVTDGEQRKYHNFWTYPVHGLSNTAPDGFEIPFAAGHARRPGSPLARSATSATRIASWRSPSATRRYLSSRRSALSLMYPADGIPGYPREAFIEDVLNEHENEIRRCLGKGAHMVQIDFTGRLAMKVDPSGYLLNRFIDLNNLALSRFAT